MGSLQYSKGLFKGSQRHQTHHHHQKFLESARPLFLVVGGPYQVHFAQPWKIGASLWFWWRWWVWWLLKALGCQPTQILHLRVCSMIGLIIMLQRNSASILTNSRPSGISCPSKRPRVLCTTILILFRLAGDLGTQGFRGSLGATALSSLWFKQGSKDVALSCSSWVYPVSAATVFCSRFPHISLQFSCQASAREIAALSAIWILNTCESQTRESEREKIRKIDRWRVSNLVE